MNDPFPSSAPVSHAPVAPRVEPTTWHDALTDLITARIAMIKLELKQAAQSGIKRAIFFAAAALLLLFTWPLILLGVIGAISATTGFPWYWSALIAAAIHILLALILVKLGKRPSDPGFPHTLNEFKKDREWLKKFQSPKKSNA